jgi:hypothetical protein
MEELAGYVISVAEHVGAEYLSLKIVVHCQEIRSHGKALFRTRGGQKKRHSFSRSQVKVGHLFDLSRRRHSKL